MKSKDLIVNNIFFVLGIAILIIVIVINFFPEGYVFAGGDTAQLINAKDSFSKFFYLWSGGASPFYFIFYFLSRMGISDTAQLSWYLGIFIIGSYISFYTFLCLFRSSTDSIVRMLASLFYALNIFTLYVFTANWGYSHFLFFYIFIPVLTALYIKFIKTGLRLHGSLFTIVLFLASSGFGNPAFALSFAIFLFIITLFLVILEKININKSFLFNAALLAVFSFLILAYWLLPIIPQMKSGVENVYSSDILELNWVISQYSNPIVDTVRLAHYSDNYFPENFPYKNLLPFKSVIIILTFLPAILAIFGLIFLKLFIKEDKKTFLYFWALFLILILLVAKVRPPFEVINHFFYNIWGINTMRGYDKVAVYLPFILTFLVLLTISLIKKRIIAISILILLLLVPLPFYLGRIQQNISYRFSAGTPGKINYTNSTYSFLVKIPEEYYSIKNYVDNDGEKNYIASLPFSDNDGSGIANYPKWKLYGVDITKYLYNKSLIEANGFYFAGWNFAQDFNEKKNAPEWIINLLGMMNVRYILYHKDIPNDSFLESIDKIQNLQNRGLIKLIEDNSYFSLYKIDNRYFFPYISWQKNDFFFNNDLDAIISGLEKAREDIHPVDFREINPKKYEINMKKDFIGDLVLAETYNQNWIAYGRDKDGKDTEIKSHFMARGYANGWKITENDNYDKIIIEYGPMRLFWIGSVISILTLMLLIGYLVYYYNYYYGHKKND